MSEFKDLTEKILRFRQERNWEKFHNPKDMALSLVLEASEVLEHFQWRNNAELKDYLDENRTAVGDELADVLYWVLLLSNDLGINLSEAFLHKMAKNEKKYPLEKARGSHTKYSKL